MLTIFRKDKKTIPYRKTEMYMNIQIQATKEYFFITEMKSYRLSDKGVLSEDVLHQGQYIPGRSLSLSMQRKR